MKVNTSQQMQTHNISFNLTAMLLHFASQHYVVRLSQEGNRDRPRFFYSFDCNEPKHVHVQREKLVCKYYLDPVVLSKNYGFSPKDLNGIRKLIQSNLNQVFGGME